MSLTPLGFAVGAYVLVKATKHLWSPKPLCVLNMYSVTDIIPEMPRAAFTPRIPSTGFTPAVGGNEVVKTIAVEYTYRHDLQEIYDACALYADVVMFQGTPGRAFWMGRGWAYSGPLLVDNGKVFDIDSKGLYDDKTSLITLRDMDFDAERIIVTMRSQPPSIKGAIFLSPRAPLIVTPENIGQIRAELEHFAKVLRTSNKKATMYLDFDLEVPVPLAWCLGKVLRRGFFPHMMTMHRYEPVFSE